MNIKNFLRCGYTFSQSEYELETRYIMTTLAVTIIAVVMLVSSLFYYLDNDIDNLYLYLFAFLVCSIALILTRVVGKENYHNIVYSISLIFTLIILYGYYLSPDQYPISTWITIQILASFLVLDISLGILITITYGVYLMIMNELLGYHSMQYILMKSTPVVIAVVLIYFIKQKFSTTIQLLEQSNKYLEMRVEERTKDLKVEKEALDYQAHYDFLTLLPNRKKFQNEIQKWIEEDKERIQPFCLLYIDLDRFKRVNDSLGHTVGDKVLQIVATRVSNLLGEEAFLSRIGGDEFTLLHRYNNDINDIHCIAQDIIKIIEKPIILEEHKLYISASIGISCYPENSVYHADLIKYADTTMFEAKKLGRGAYKFYTEEMTHMVKKTVLLETEIRTALEHNDFILFYQPQVDMRTGTMSGMEVLVRWNHATLGFVLPDLFIPLAEETGVIMALDSYILKKGMHQIVKWKTQGLDIPRVAFNFSTKHLEQDGFVSFIKALLTETECKGEWIELEITESHIMSNMENSIIVLEALHDLGIKIAIDDFGTGYSSLAYLKRLPVDKLKIDKLFIGSLSQDTIDMTITNAIIEIAKSMKLTVIAEGVETDIQKEYLLENDCHYAQGYLYHKAMPVEDIEKMVPSKKVWVNEKRL